MRTHRSAFVTILLAVLGTTLGPSLCQSAPAWAATGVDCGGGASLQTAIDEAPAGSTLVVTGTCVGTFQIAKSLTLRGAVGNTATLDGQGAGTTLSITKGKVHLDQLTITGGNADQGGGIANSAKLWLDRTAVTGNVSWAGGGILNSGSVWLTRSSVSSNGNSFTYDGVNHPVEGIVSNGYLALSESSVSLNLGGGIWNESGSLFMDRSVVDGNRAGGPWAAGIESEGSATITKSTVSNNFTEYNGTPGIFNMGSMSLALSTISGNVGFNNNSGGGGIENGGTLSVTGSTIVHNNSDAVTGSGIANGHALDGIPAGTVTISGSILAGNQGGDCLGPITSEGYNFLGTLFGYPDCKFIDQPTDIRGGSRSRIDPELKGLGDYGGPTETMPPYVTSPVISGIHVRARSADRTVALCRPSGTTDQRGMPRPQGGACEIGAVEVQP